MEKIIDELRELANKLEKEQKTKDNKQRRQPYEWPHRWPINPYCPCSPYRPCCRPNQIIYTSDNAAVETR